MLLRAVRHKRDAGTGTPAGLTDTKEGHRYMLMAFTMESYRLRAVFFTRKQSTGLFPASLGRWEETHMDDKALKIVRDYIWEHLDKSDELAALNFNFEVYVVWKAKALQNWKSLISSTLLDGM